MTPHNPNTSASLGFLLRFKGRHKSKWSIHFFINNLAFVLKGYHLNKLLSIQNFSESCETNWSLIALLKLHKLTQKNFLDLMKVFVITLITTVKAFESTRPKKKNVSSKTVHKFNTGKKSTFIINKLKLRIQIFRNHTKWTT